MSGRNNQEYLDRITKQLENLTSSGGGGGGVDLTTIETELATLNATTSFISTEVENIEESTTSLANVRLQFNDWELQQVGNRKVITYTTSTPTGGEEIDTISYYQTATLAATLQLSYVLASDGISNLVSQVERIA